MIPARLNEQTARKIAYGRGKSIIEQYAEAAKSSPPPPASRKPGVQVRYQQNLMRRILGAQLLCDSVDRRSYFAIALLPDETDPGAWIMCQIKLKFTREGTEDGPMRAFILVRFTQHAVARLLERKARSDVEGAFVQEIGLPSVIELIRTTREHEDRLASEFVLPDQHYEFQWRTPNGYFVCTDTRSLIIAKTWIGLSNNAERNNVAIQPKTK
jgi:hypothetical protein